MPELPEVEVTMQELRSRLMGKRITKFTDWKSSPQIQVPNDLSKNIRNKKISSICRRNRYILVGIGIGYLLLHLGVNGNLRLSRLDKPFNSHDRVEFQIENDLSLRLRARRPLRIVVCYVEGDPYNQPPFASYGPEPFDDGFTGSYLYQVSRNRKSKVKNFIKNKEVVVGIGNIYTSELLYDAGIHPETKLNKISECQYESLAKSVKKILNAAIEDGGTTLEDRAWVSPTGNYGNYQRRVYGQAGQPCFRCGKKILKSEKSPRYYYCEQCQELL